MLCMRRLVCRQACLLAALRHTRRCRSDKPDETKDAQTAQAPDDNATMAKKDTQVNLPHNAATEEETATAAAATPRREKGEHVKQEPQTPAEKDASAALPNEHSTKDNNNDNDDDAAATQPERIRGFEGFYASMLTNHMLPGRSPAESIKRGLTVSAAERVLTRQLMQRARTQRVMRRLSILSLLLLAVVGYRYYRVQSHMRADTAGYAVVTVDPRRHRAAFFDAEGRLIGVRRFIDYDTFVRQNCDGDKDVLVLVPSYYPWLPMLVLCLLPIVAVFAGGVRRSVQAIAQVEQAKQRFRFDRQLRVPTTLRDVAGLAEAKKEVTEVVSFLRRPEHYRALGARLPKGVLLDGPPGVGKTLLAKAIAGEAMVPFLSCSGSEFDEVYVGVGAQRVRQLFAEAHKCKPCVVFIDEIDAVGRRRQGGDGGGGSSSRGTLNAFLAEMDGFKDAAGIIVLAATNRADVLDKALTRSGRFDRKITLDLPSHQDRVDVALVHLRPLRLNPVRRRADYAETIAALTPGCSGADIFNVCNEAAIQAARRGAATVDLTDFHHAVERVLVGLERSAVKYTPPERERLAYHEAGVVVLNWFLAEVDPVVKTTTLPRGRHRTGVTQRLPQNTFISTETRLRQDIVGCLGGYVAEETFFNDISTSAAADLRRATAMARRMICVYGMDPEHIGHIGYDMDNTDALQKPFGPAKEDVVDSATNTILQASLAQARQLLEEHTEHVRSIATLLLERQTLTAHDLWRVLGDRPYMSKELKLYLGNEGSSESGEVEAIKEQPSRETEVKVA